MSRHEHVPVCVWYITNSICVRMSMSLYVRTYVHMCTCWHTNWKPTNLAHKPGWQHLRCPRRHHYVFIWFVDILCLYVCLGLLGKRSIMRCLAGVWFVWCCLWMFEGSTWVSFFCKDIGSFVCGSHILICLWMVMSRWLLGCLDIALVCLQFCFVPDTIAFHSIGRHHWASYVASYAHSLMPVLWICLSNCNQSGIRLAFIV